MALTGQSLAWRWKTPPPPFTWTHHSFQVNIFQSVCLLFTSAHPYFMTFSLSLHLWPLLLSKRYLKWNIYFDWLPYEILHISLLMHVFFKKLMRYTDFHFCIFNKFHFNRNKKWVKFHLQFWFHSNYTYAFWLQIELAHLSSIFTPLSIFPRNW